MFCRHCGYTVRDEDKYCNDCGGKLSAPENDAITAGDRSVNTQNSTITNSSIHTGDNYTHSNNIDPDILNLRREFVRLPWSSEGKLGESSGFLTLGTIGSIASIVGIVLPWLTSFKYIPHFLFPVLALSMMMLLLPTVLKRHRFSPFFGLKNLEYGKDGKIYLTRISCDCPWCGTEMKLRMVGP
ncbi:MAG TPA: zinc ribbon domain-containing protein, partial [Enterobacteriaceae bacterium]|nr:zinc ribbon domain-containing protein [Enterobacteriaceae bacterium]